jgi:endonuclease III
MPDLKDLLARLKLRYGAPAMPRAKGPFEQILWENACYLLPDTRRAEVFEALREQVGLTPKQILEAGQVVLLPLAKRGGMRPETRVFRWREIARITLDQFDSDLDALLKLPYKEAKKALKQFPNIGDPAAEKILLYSGVTGELPLESNGLRVLTRFGFGREQKNYGATYRSVQEAIANDLPRGSRALAQAHLLLRKHGQTLCKRNRPDCEACPVADVCAFNLAGSSRTPSARW